jgi:DNA repair protein RAD50
MMAAMVEKMSIMGIRSFSPHHECSIEFYSPLTMIVGANGCGKTTIIECLKYACTGSLPPNVQMGKNFINDPSITDSIEVKANIKLRFRNKSGTPCVVVRTLNVTKKKTKLEFKALDGVVMTTNALGDKVSMSVKCSELDKQIPELLGVSAAIMENVIFLHQEDSNWPMSEGAVLKKKFDDVFESTRYAKALEAFSKSKKDYASKSKELKGELMELGAHLEAARATENELEACRTQEETGSHDLDSLSDRVNQCDERIANIKETIARLDRGANERKELQWRLTESDNRVKETRAKMEEFYANESDEDLLNMIQNCDQDTDSKKKQLSSLQKKNEELKKELTEFR